MKDKRKCKNPIICKLVTPVDQRGRSMLLTLNLTTNRSSNFKTTQHLTNTSIRQNNKIGKKTEKELHHHL